MSPIETEAERADALADLLAGRFPDERGRYGPFGGRYVPETLIPAHERLERGVRPRLRDAEFRAELERELRDWVGRPTALSPAPHLSKRWGAKVWLKREDLAHTGAHKINNAIGQALLARRLGARRIVAETGAGQHGVASAAACARVGLPCTVYMGELDMERQAPNVGRMKLLGAKVIPVTSGDRTLRAAIDEALRDWVSDPNGTYYLLGSAVGGHPYPYLVRELQAVIGREARAQMLERAGALPDAIVACVGGGSNAIGLFHAFLGDAGVEILGIEAGGRGAALGENAVALGRVRYETADDHEALEAVRECCECEGILPALESAHALAGARRWAAQHPGGRVSIGLSGRGDKDMPTLSRTLIAPVPEKAP